MRLIRGKVRLQGLMQAAAALTILVSIATLFDGLHRYLELFSHFRLQYLVVTTILAIGLVALRDRPWSLAMLALTAINAWPIGVWHLAKVENAAVIEARIKLLHINVYSANDDAQALAELIGAESPDIVFAQEVTAQWGQALGLVRSDYPYGHLEVREDNFGIAVLSRAPLASIDIIDSPPYGFPTLVVRQEINDEMVTFVSTHAMPPLGADGYAARNEQLASVAELLSSISGPKVLIGDLNTSMWSQHYAQLVEETELIDSRYGFGVIPSWPTQLPFAMIPIDHCLLSREFVPLATKAGPGIGSDHLPLIVELGITDTS